MAIQTKPDDLKAAVETNPDCQEVAIQTKPDDLKAAVETKPECQEVAIQTKPDDLKAAVETKPECQEVAIQTKPDCQEVPIQTYSGGTAAEIISRQNTKFVTHVLYLLFHAVISVVFSRLHSWSGGDWESRVYSF